MFNFYLGKGKQMERPKPQGEDGLLPELDDLADNFALDLEDELGIAHNILDNEADLT